MHGNTIYAIISNVTFGFGAQTSCSIIQIITLPPVCSFSCTSSCLHQTEVLFTVMEESNSFLDWEKKNKRKRTQELHYAAVSTLYIMFKVAFEELNGLKYSRIIQVFCDPYDAWFNINTLDREVQHVFLTSDKQQPKGDGFISFTSLIVIFSHTVFWSSLPCW